MADLQTLLDALAPVLDVVATVDPDDPGALATLEEKLPLQSPALVRVKELFAEGRAAGWLCDREAGGVRFSRVKKAGEDGLSIDAVHMSSPGPGHTHPRGEVDLCFAVEGEPRFDGRAPGWTVYPAGSWHVPTVTGGVMDILYFLPGGAIEFGPRPG